MQQNAHTQTSQKMNTLYISPIPEDSTLQLVYSHTENILLDVFSSGWNKKKNAMSKCHLKPLINLFFLFYFLFFRPPTITLGDETG